MVTGLSARRELSPTTVRYALTVLRIALRRAVKSGRAIRNVAELIDQPRAVRYEVRPLTLEEVSRFLGSVRGDRLEAMYVTQSAWDCARESSSASVGTTSTSRAAP